MANDLMADFHEADASMRGNDTIHITNLLFAIGVLMGANCPGSAAAVRLATERLYPDLQADLDEKFGAGA